IELRRRASLLTAAVPCIAADRVDELRPAAVVPERARDDEQHAEGTRRGEARERTEDAPKTPQDPAKNSRTIASHFASRSTPRGHPFPVCSRPSGPSSATSTTRPPEKRP